mmetsp:Transcript_130578/g.230796  ORF Transcript_130578/g.230796 Transcript_130578/m.230796 type:complete len:212 (-) Transcript_130578:1710-2345(-)
MASASLAQVLQHSCQVLLHQNYYLCHFLLQPARRCEVSGAFPTTCVADLLLHCWYVGGRHHYAGLDDVATASSGFDGAAPAMPHLRVHRQVLPETDLAFRCGTNEALTDLLDVQSSNHRDGERWNPHHGEKPKVLLRQGAKQRRPPQRHRHQPSLTEQCARVGSCWHRLRRKALRLVAVPVPPHLGPDGDGARCSLGWASALQLLPYLVDP